MAVRLPAMHLLIRSAGVMVTGRVCSCCMCRPVYEISATPTVEPDVLEEFFYVCAACDVQEEHRAK